MGTKGLVSIIVPVYNIEDFLPKCLDTLARQTYTNLEIILVDDGSTDSTGLICDRFAEQDPRAVVIHHKENKQLWAARNTGQAAARGEFIMFVDGDDYLHLDAVRAMRDAIDLDDGYDMAIIDYKETSSLEEDIETECPGDRMPLTQDEIMKDLFRHWTSIWNKLYRHDVIKDVWAHPYERAQDIDFSFRSFLKIKKAIWIKRTLYYYVQREGSAIHKPGAKLIGTQCVVNLLYDNIIHLPNDKLEYQHIILKKLYERMVDLIRLFWNTPKRNSIIAQCRQYEKRVHSLFWGDTHYGSAQKAALYMNIRFPYVVRIIKKITGGRLSWSQLANNNSNISL